MRAARPIRRSVDRPLGSVLLLSLLLLLAAGTARAWGETLLPGLDPLLHGTDDPALLGVERQLLRERMLAFGVDPARGEGLPTYDTRMRKLFDDRSGMDFERRIVVVESAGPLGIETVFTYPEYFVLFQAPRTLPGGFVYYPPRNIDAPDVELFVDELGRAMQRRLDTANRRTLRTDLDVYGRGGAGGRDQGLINLTIPIKLPRTLEKIIGRGEKTSIKISGSERISISGESTVSNRFTPNERRQSQSLFPTLDMEQSLRINLSGQIGEKIILEVDHNSEAIGPDATQIHLSYQGSEDEIIQSIITGDVGLTLPNSRLLGYSSNKSGLFGLKVEGQLGPAEFTVVASKQKAESTAKDFNAQGGSETEHIIEAWRYLNNRFFRLDLPRNDFILHERPDVPGRDRATQSIDVGSVQVYQFVTGRQQDGDVRNIVAVPDTTGVWNPAAVQAALDDGSSSTTRGELWRPVEHVVLRDQNDDLVAIDLKREYDASDVLAVTYLIRNPDGTTTRVGENPASDTPTYEVQDELYYKLKLLKPQQPEPFTWQYVLRNIYSLGGTGINASSFEFRVERNIQGNFPELDQREDGSYDSGLQWFRIFGLDTEDQQSNPGHDDIVDVHDQYRFDFTGGLLKFPLNVTEPFNADPSLYATWADSSSFDFDQSALSENLIPEIYDWRTNQNELSRYNQFRFVAKHAAASSSFNLGQMNIEEGSESVILDGRTLVRDQDYTIDYTFGEIQLKGDAAATISADSSIKVNYQYAPFLGGGNSSLLGFNVGLDLGRESRLSTTWLYESNQVVGHKAKLGEEPSRTLVGNLSGAFTFRPGFLTSFANLISRRDSDRESELKVSGEVALSVPNPNTFDEVFVEDFEGIDSSDLMPVSRVSWSDASVPSHAEGLQAPVPDDQAGLLGRSFTPANRLDARWFLPRVVTQRRHLNPELREQEARETQQVLQMHLRTEDGAEWTEDSWGGIMRGLGRNGLDLTKTQFLEFWVNDYRHEVLGDLQHGTLHFDFGYISEDFYWPERDGLTVIGEYEREDGILGDLPDGVWEYTEDVGLGYDESDTASPSNPADRFNADYGSSDNPYPNINGTAGNNREDSEDLDGDSVHDLQNGFYSIAVSLGDSALVDVLRDYPAEEVQDNIDNNMAWRKYRLRLSDAVSVIPPGGTNPSLTNVTHMRIWFEEDAPPDGQTVRNIQLAEIKFLGSRWEREGVRKVPTADAPEEYLLTPAELPAGDAFFIGEVNNKENPDYAADPPPFPLHVENQVEEKETSLVLDYQNLGQDHLVRISRLISPRGEDFTQYEKLRWYAYNPDPDQADMELFYRVGADSLNYYEVNYRFDQSDGARTGWRAITLNLAEISNVKLEVPDPATGWSSAWVPDAEKDREYLVRVVGQPDLRRIKRFYLGVRNTDRSRPASGYFYFNDVRLREVKREKGIAEQVVLNLNMADVITANFDWARRDAEFHGLDRAVGQGFTSENWSLSGNTRIDDFVPLLGFRIPVSGGMTSDVSKPKYITNSDIEILDEDLRERESTRAERQNFSVRLNRTPSTNPVLRYVVDPLALTLAGARNSNHTPLLRQSGHNLSGSIAYDLRIPGNRRLGDLPLLGRVPVVKAVGLLPSRLSFSANLSGSTTHTANWNVVDQAFISRAVQKARSGQLNGSFSYKPLPIVDLDVTLRSDRDLFRENEVLGLNIGEENLFDQRVQLRFSPPQRLSLPDFWLFSPAKALMKSMRSIKPTLNYNGSFTDDHALRVAQEDDPPGTRNVQNTGDWTFRMSLPLDQAVNRYFPKKRGLSDAERQARIRQQEVEAQRGRSELPPVEEDPRLQDPNLTEEEFRAIYEEILLERADRADEEAEDRRGRAEPDTTVVAEADGPRFRIPNPLPHLLDVVRGTQPVQISYSKQENSGYGRLRQGAPFWYKAGFYQDIDVADSLFVSHGFGERKNLTLSTTSRINKWMSVDVSFAQLRADNTQAGVRTRTYNQEWPDANLKLTGLEKWGLLGGPKDGPFRAMSLNVSYKYTKNVAGYTETVYNPRRSRQFSPRLNMTLQNDMSISLNVTSNRDRNDQSGNLTVADRLNVGLQVRHTFRAERLLSRLGLYKPGAQPMVNMDVNLQYSDNATSRWQAGQSREEEPSTITGTSRISFEPKFSYNITRNLSGSLRFIYSRDKIKETDLVTQRFGLGLEATFVF